MYFSISFCSYIAKQYCFKVQILEDDEIVMGLFDKIVKDVSKKNDKKINEDEFKDGKVVK